VALVGDNGAGKTTALKTVAGLIEPLSGEIHFRQEAIGTLTAPEVNRLGISLIPEDLCLFSKMTVADNLSLGAFTVKDRNEKRRTMDLVLDLFPVLADRRQQLAGTLSGGERKMLAIGRGLMSSPELLLVDEPSLGLAPNLVSSVLDVLAELNEGGLTILLVEQNAHATLELTQRTYVLEQGRIALKGRSRDLSESDHVRKSYLGLSGE